MVIRAPEPAGTASPGVNLQQPVPVPAASQTAAGAGTRPIGDNANAGTTAAGSTRNDTDDRRGRDGSALPPADQYAQAPAPALPNFEPSRPPTPTPTPTPPPVGAPATVTAPPITVPTPSGPAAAAAVPTVEAYDEITHRAAAGDTYESISKTYYHSDVFAKALRLFNLNHPRSTMVGRKDTAQLEVGQAVYVPPAEILQKQYAREIDLPPLAPTAAAPAGLAAPRTTNFTPQAPLPATPAAPAAPQAAQKTYQVRAPAGEMLYDIARQTLGTGERWNEIAKLNPTYPPAYPVKAGTVLLLPADAKVPVDVRP